MSDEKTGTLRLYDDLEKRVRPFEPRAGNKVNMYVCGVTVYGPCHIGHARAYIVFDVIRRWLEHKGYDVFYIQNFTDVDDKIINKANAEGVAIDVISSRYVEEYFRDMDALGIKRADAYPRATEYIQEMLDMTGGLIEKGFAYESDGNVFFEVNKFKGYGKLSGRGESERSVQEPAPGKRDNADFALWKKSQPGEPAWDSPWGPGRPGWHLECSAMSLKLAGGPLDIHGGGMDLLFPHHENEIAQSEAFSGEQFSNYWMHNGFIEVDKEKMSKSLGNITNVGEVLKTHDGNALRLFFLGAHYRMPINFSFDRLREAETALDRFSSMFKTIESISARADDTVEQSGAVAAAAEELKKAFSEAEIEFARAMDDDFNTPAAIAQIFTMLRRINAFAAAVQNENEGRVSVGTKNALIAFSTKMVDFAGILGIDLRKSGVKAAEPDAVDKLMQVLIKVRAESRKQKNWAFADMVRDMLLEAGFSLEDRADGTSWKKT